MSAGGQGAANNALLSVEEVRAIESAESQRQALEKLAREAEQAYEGALAKVDKQKAHVAAAEAEAKPLHAVATKARKAADKAQ